MGKQNGGQDLQAAALGGGGQAAYTGVATATSATSLTATGTPLVASAHVGRVVTALSTTSSKVTYGVITANTTSVLTVDRWYDPANPTSTALGTPASTAVFAILPVAASAFYMAISTNGTVNVTDTTLSSEYNTAGGGLNRQAATYAHTTGVNTYTLTGSFVANATDVSSGGLPLTFQKMGTFNALTSGVMLHESTFTGATLTASGDTLTLTQTITM